MNEIISTNRCFMCGKENPIGLKMEIKYENGEARSEIFLDKNYEGYNGIIHGGIISAILDEIAVYAALSINKICLTYEISVRFKKPVHSGKKYYAFGKVIEEKGRIVICESEIKDEDNNICASSSVKLFNYKGAST
uniref:Acyl-coenzyme A thioesterase THEM4 n=1 Tax=candidate division WOR-3 bacterium TaxID=2052148 RepID=A0A7C4Y5E7_UNCW3